MGPFYKGVRRPVGRWPLLAVTTTAVVGIFYVARSLGAPFGGTSQGTLSATPRPPEAPAQSVLESLIGRNVDLPMTDSEGIWIDHDRVRLVIAMPDCESCTARSFDVTELAEVTKGNTVYIIPNSVSNVPERTKHSLAGNWYVFDAPVKSIPSDLALHSPQIVCIDQGRIVEVPRLGESMLAFAQRVLRR